MSRYVKNFYYNAVDAGLLNSVHQQLLANGYNPGTYQGEQVYVKGGTVAVARHIKISQSTTQIRLEAWVNTNFLVASDEVSVMDPGFVGSQPKNSAKKTVLAVENLLVSYPGFLKAEEETSPYGYGAPQPGYGAPKGAVDPAGYAHCPDNLTRKEFMDMYLSDELKKSVKSTAITLYVLCALKLLFAIILGVVGFYSGSGIVLELMSTAVILALSVGYHTQKHSGFAIGITVILGVTLFLNLVSTGTFGGWWWVLAGVYAITSSNRAEKEYQAYLNAKRYMIGA